MSEIEIELTFGGHYLLNQSDFICPIYLNSENCDFIHFYFNNKTEEQKLPFDNIVEKINKVKIVMEYNIKSFGYLFNHCKKIKEIKINKFHRNNIIDMQYMFSNCSSLTNLDISKLSSDNVINMCNMFYGCSSLKNLNISSLKTDKVIDMRNLFYDCYSLYEL